MSNLTINEIAKYFVNHFTNIQEFENEIKNKDFAKE